MRIVQIVHAVTSLLLLGLAKNVQISYQKDMHMEMADRQGMEHLEEEEEARWSSSANAASARRVSSLNPQTITTSGTSHPEVQRLKTIAYPRVAEVQELRLSADSPISGGFSLIVDLVDASSGSPSSVVALQGSSTSILSYNAPAMGFDFVNPTVQQALLMTLACGSPLVTRTDADANGGRSWFITFIDVTQVRGNLKQLKVDTGRLKGKNVKLEVYTVINATRLTEQQLSIEGSNLAGTFALHFRGQVTSAISVTKDTHALKSAVKYALEQLHTIGGLEISVITSASVVGGYKSHVLAITFLDNIGTLPDIDVLHSPALTDTPDGVSAPAGHTGITGIGVNVNCSTLFTSGSRAAGGDFTWSFRGEALNAYVPYDATEAMMDAALEGMTSIGSVKVDRTGPDYNDLYTWRVTFETETGNLPEIVIDGSRLTGTKGYASMHASSLTRSIIHPSLLNPPIVKVTEEVRGYDINECAVHMTVPDGVLLISTDNSYAGIHANFSECCKRVKLTTVVIPDSVRSIGRDVFGKCESLTSVTIGNSVETIGEGAFKSTALTSVIIPDSVRSIGAKAFAYCKYLTSVTIGNSVETIGEDAFKVTALTSVIIPDSVRTIGKEAFEYCNYLTSVAIGNSVETIDGQAFKVTALTSVIIPDSVRSIGKEAFAYCKNLTSVTIGNSVETFGEGAFKSTALTSVIIPDSVRTIGSYAFAKCPDLASVIFPDSFVNFTQDAFKFNSPVLQCNKACGTGAAADMCVYPNPECGASGCTPEILSRFHCEDCHHKANRTGRCKTQARNESSGRNQTTNHSGPCDPANPTCDNGGTGGSSGANSGSDADACVRVDQALEECRIRRAGWAWTCDNPPLNYNLCAEGELLDPSSRECKTVCSNSMH